VAFVIEPELHCTPPPIKQKSELLHCGRVYVPQSLVALDAVEHLPLGLPTNQTAVSFRCAARVAQPLALSTIRHFSVVIAGTLPPHFGFSALAAAAHGVLG
jgi:hypothetical protein